MPRKTEEPPVDIARKLIELGMSESSINRFAHEIENQLVAKKEVLLTSLLAKMDEAQFADMVDVPALARSVGVSETTVKRAVGVLAPVIAEYGANQT